MLYGFESANPVYGTNLKPSLDQFHHFERPQRPHETIHVKARRDDLNVSVEEALALHET